MSETQVFKISECCPDCGGQFLFASEGMVFCTWKECFFQCEYSGEVLHEINTKEE